MKWDLEGKEILYSEGSKFDTWGAGTVGKIITNEAGVQQVEIIFPDSYTIQTQLLARDVFFKMKNAGEIEPTQPENANLHRWRVLERELVSKPLEEAVKEISALSTDEISTLTALLKERVEGETRLSREQAVVLLGAIGEFLDDEEEPKGIFEFLLEQTKRTIKKRGVPSVSSYGLSIKAQFQREQQKVIAQSLIAAAKVAQKMDEEMQQAVKEVAARCQTSSFKIIKDAGSEALATLQNR